MMNQGFQAHIGLKSEEFENSDDKNMVSFYLSLAVQNFTIQI